MRHNKPLSVTIAGYNIDSSIIEKIHELVDLPRPSIETDSELRIALDSLAQEPITPETISAAYARISRSPMGVKDLRRDARASVNRARQSNERIVFGLGHASVSEHAIFNLDIVDVSRLALEAIEHHRLASYTEASQRYIALTGDFLVPQEIEECGLASEFSKTCDLLFAGYRKLIESLENLHQDLPERDRNTKSREDARYVLPLACRGQVGVTINARTAETMIRSFNNSELAEIRMIGQILSDSLRKIVPSLIRYVDPRPELMINNRDIVHQAKSIIDKKENLEIQEVVLVSYPGEGERHAIASILFSRGNYSFSECLASVDKLSYKEKKELLLISHRNLREHDPILRELELGTFIFEVTLSASAFAQIKRHRMASIIVQSYDPSLGVTIPPNIERAGAVNQFEECITISDDQYQSLLLKLADDKKSVADYALTNSHRRRIVFQANARELTHLSRLREDIHAQWDIRRLSREMIRQAKDACPGLLLFASGKDRFSELQKELYPDVKKSDDFE